MCRGEAFATGRDGQAFVRWYGGAGGPDVAFSVTSGKPGSAGGERIVVNGRDASLRAVSERGRGHGYEIVWSDGGWWVSMYVGDLGSVAERYAGRTPGGDRRPALGLVLNPNLVCKLIP
jgi:hypothetical protein